MMFPVAFSLSVWSSCSEESVSSRACNSSSEGRRALRYGMELGRAAITDNTGIRTHVNTTGFHADIHVHIKQDLNTLEQIFEIQMLFVEID